MKYEANLKEIESITSELIKRLTIKANLNANFNLNL